MKKVIIIAIILLAVSVCYADVNFNIKMKDAKFLLLKEALLWKNPQPTEPNEVRDLTENQWARKAFYKMVDKWVYRVLREKDWTNTVNALVERVSDGTDFMEDQ